jgi:heat shock 70kDa protein 4
LNADIIARKIQIHSVEIVGGASRTPIIQKIIQEVFNLEVSRTLNMSECIARGCAMQAAMISPLFKVASYEVEEANFYPIKCSWIFFNKNQGKRYLMKEKNLIIFY